MTIARCERLNEETRRRDQGTMKVHGIPGVCPAHRRQLRRHITVAALGLMLVLVPCTVRAGDEFQFWLGATTAVDLAKQWKATIGVQTRYDDRGDLVRHHSDLGVVYKGLAHWLDLGLNYRAIFTKLVDEEWKNANRGYLNVTVRSQLMGIAFSDRVRLEYSDFEDFGSFGTVRNRIMLNPPFELEPDRERLIFRRYTVKPYGSYEIFYDTLDNAVTRQRFQVGFSVVFTDRIVGDISFIREDSTSQIDGTDLNIVSATLKLLF